MMQVTLEVAEKARLMHSRSSTSINHGSTSHRNHHRLNSSAVSVTYVSTPSENTNIHDDTAGSKNDKKQTIQNYSVIILLIFLYHMVVQRYVHEFLIVATAKRGTVSSHVALATGQQTSDNDVKLVHGNFGQDRDEHGCIGSAGYQWCQKLSQCVQPWETPCEE